MLEGNNKKKVIALSCSPSRGRNSDTMLDNFIRGVVEEGVLIEKIYLEDVPMDHYNYQNGKMALPHETVFNDLIEKIKGANGLVIATPTYNFSVPAQLKNFIDRIRFIALDLSKRDGFGQPAGLLGYLTTYFLISGGIPKWAERILFFAFPAFWLRGVFLYYGAKVCDAYYSGDVKTFENTRILNNCYKKGKQYAYRLKKGKGNRILERLFWRPFQRE